LQKCVEDPRLAGLREPVSALFRDTADLSLRGEVLPDPERRAADLLEAIVAAVSASGEGTPYGRELGLFVRESSLAALWDAVLDEMRRWARLCGLDILPRKWSFRELVQWQQLEPEEQKAAIARFSTVDRGRVFLQDFGLADAAGALKSAPRCVVSAGPAPAFYSTLMELTAHGQTEAPAQLHDTLATWPAERLRDQDEDRLLGLAVHLFVLYWRYHPQWQVDDAERQGLFRRSLEGMLTQAFHLEIREPKDRDITAGDWVTVREQPPRGGQHLKQVVRPALFLAEGFCKVTAEVDLQ